MVCEAAGIARCAVAGVIGSGFCSMPPVQGRYLPSTGKREGETGERQVVFVVASRNLVSLFAMQVFSGRLQV